MRHKSDGVKQSNRCGGPDRKNLQTEPEFMRMNIYTLMIRLAPRKLVRAISPLALRLCAAVAVDTI